MARRRKILEEIGDPERGDYGWSEESNVYIVDDAETEQQLEEMLRRWEREDREQEDLD